MMLKKIVFATTLILPVAWAHPAIGIVMDATGAVFYSDTAQVWRISPNGTKSIAVPNVHTHELWLDAEGALYGEHLAGGASWSHRVWKRSPDGKVTDVFPTRKGFLYDYKDFSFARDNEGAMYWLDRARNGRLLKRKARGAIQTVAELEVPEAGWMSVLPDGTAIVVDHGSLIRVTKGGQVRKMPVALSQKTERYSVMGVWADQQGNIYAAVYGSAEVKKITPEGQVTTVATSPAPWQPTGGLIAPDGALWVLETSPANAQQVRRIAPSGAARVF